MISYSETQSGESEASIEASFALSDQRFWKLYEAANELGAVMYIHPTNPVGVEAMLDYWLMPLVGFLFDTTLAAAGLVFSGVAERFPRIRWVLGHLGGAIPYLAETGQYGSPGGRRTSQSRRANTSNASISIR